MKHKKIVWGIVLIITTIALIVSFYLACSMGSLKIMLLFTLLCSAEIGAIYQFKNV